MPFTIVENKRAWWPVNVDLVDENGAVATHSFEIRFRLLKVDQAVEVEHAVRDATAQELAGTADLAGIYAGLVERIADDWRQVLAENGEPLRWATENLRALMNEPRMFTRVFEAFRACLNAAPEIRAGK